MPYLFQFENEWTLLYCSAPPSWRRRRGELIPARERPWKLHWSYPYVAAAGRIGTGLSEIDSECSPCASVFCGELMVSFVGTCHSKCGESRTHRGVNGIPHRLFRLTGKTVDRLQKAEEVSDRECYAGFCRHDLTAISSGLDNRVELSGEVRGTLITSFSALARVGYCFDYPWRLILTGFDTRGFVHSLIYDLATHTVLGEILVDGEPTYKPSICGGKLVRPLTGQRESPLWKLKESEVFNIVATPLTAAFTEAS